MSLFSEFRQFVMRGNVVDMAVGIVIGASFGKIVASLVDKIVMPITGYLTGGVDFAERTVTLPVPELGPGMKPPELGWGAFVQAVIDFGIVALAIFMVVKLMNRHAHQGGKPTRRAAGRDRPAAGNPRRTDQSLTAQIREIDGFSLPRPRGLATAVSIFAPLAVLWYAVEAESSTGFLPRMRDRCTRNDMQL